MENGQERTGRYAKKTLEIFVVCIFYGAAYGAALGATSGAILGVLAPLMRPLAGLIGGAFAGVLCGAIGGGVFAIVGRVIKGRVGWLLGGLLGGAVFPVGFWRFPAADYGWDLFVILVSAASILLGGFLALALDTGLPDGTSAVPGVRELTAILQGDGFPPQQEHGV